MTSAEKQDEAFALAAEFHRLLAAVRADMETEEKIKRQRRQMMLAYKKWQHFVQENRETGGY
jgi:hypothetical protein